jgi:hypothetical protein
MACGFGIDLFDGAIRFERGCRNCAIAYYGLLVCYGTEQRPFMEVYCYKLQQKQRFWESPQKRKSPRGNDM